MSEYIGRRISLVSKSDIRYVGTLHEINSESLTVALENVTSYGTEGRKGNDAEEIPGSDNVYEYIVFRGSDVKDLNIVNGPGEKENQPPKMPDDPAILNSTRPPPQNQPPPQQPPNQNQFRGPQPPYPPQQQFGYQGPPGQFLNQPRFQGPGGPHGFPGTPGAVPGYGQGFGGPPPPGYGMGYGPPPGQGFPPGPPPGHFNHNQQMPIGPPEQHMNQQRPPQQMQGQQHPPIGSNKSTPQPGPQMQPPQAQGKPVEMSATPGPSESSTGPPPPVDSKPSMAAATAPSAATQAQQETTKPLQKTNSRVAVPLPNPNALGAKPPQKPTTASAATATVAPPTGQPQSIEDATQAATAAVAAAMAKLGPVNQNQAKATPDSTDNLTQKVNQMRLQDNQNQRGRGRGRGGPPRGGRRDSAQRAVEVPKEDFDFESSNAKFDREKLAEEANPTTSPVGSPNGDAADPLAATNGHANGEDGDDVVIPPSDKSYDKKSSFFDNISSDLKDRIDQAKDDASPVNGRAMRTQERTKNMETFGQGSVDGGYRGGYRGRGRGFGNYRGRGNGGYRGGRGGFEYRGTGYRGRGGRGGQEATFV